MNLSPTIKDRIQTLLREKIRADEHFKDGYEELPQHTGETERWPKRGAFGFVHRMLRMEDLEEVAVKVIELNYRTTDFLDRNLSKRSKSVSSDSDLTFDFLSACQEAVLQSHEEFHHPNIVRCYESWIQPPTENTSKWQDNIDVDLLLDFVNNEELTSDIRKCLKAAKGLKVYIVMDLYTQNLDEFYKQEIQPSRDITLSILSQIAHAISFVHSKKYIHRDLKPKNILVRTTGEDYVEAAIGDFGLCRRIEGSTGFHGGCGTPPYNTAPETDCTTKFDMWALGILMFEILYVTSDNTPSAHILDKAITQIIELARNGKIDQLKQAVGQRVGVKSIKNLIVRCLHKDPTQRITAEEVCSKECMKRLPLF